MKTAFLPWLFTILGLAACQQQVACPAPVASPASDRTISSVTFRCKEGKGFVAHFYLPEDPYADLELSDGRKLRLYRGPAASGILYASADERIEFRNKGNEARIEEGGKETYVDCLTK